MTLLDDQGRLFGLINLVDALVVLVVLAVVLAGATFVFTGGSGSSSYDTTTRYATLDLGTQPSYVATLVTENDTVESASDTQNLTITDVYATPTDDGNHVYVRARITGPLSDDTLTYAGDPLRVGRSLDLATPEYETSGTVTAVDASTPSLPVENADVLLRATLPAERAAAIREGDQYRVDGRTVATVQSVTAYRTGNGSTRVEVGVTYRAYRSSDGPVFAGTPVREGASLPLATDAYAFDGDVVRVGALSPRGRATTRTVELRLAGVDPSLAAGLHAGMTERVRGKTLARLTDVSVRPATVVLTSQDGHVYERDHPVKKDVTLTAELRVRETATGVRFAGAPLQQGDTVTLDFGTVTVEATVGRV